MNFKAFPWSILNSIFYREAMSAFRFIASPGLPWLKPKRNRGHARRLSTSRSHDPSTFKNTLTTWVTTCLALTIGWNILGLIYQQSVMMAVATMIRAVKSLLTGCIFGFSTALPVWDVLCVFRWGHSLPRPSHMPHTFSTMSVSASTSASSTEAKLVLRILPSSAVYVPAQMLISICFLILATLKCSDMHLRTLLPIKCLFSSWLPTADVAAQRRISTLSSIKTHGST